MTGTMIIHQDRGFQLIDGNHDLFRMNFKEGLDRGHGKTNCDVVGGGPSDALLLALGYLRLRDLLAVEKVCKSLRDAVRGDPLLWRSIHIDYPFSFKITDSTLIKLTNRAQGHLHTLSLYNCSKITNVGLIHVLERNPSLTKLNVRGCLRLTIDGILSNLKVLKAAGKTRLKYLGISGLFGVTNQHIEEIKLLTGADNSKLPTTHKPQFFSGDQLRVTSDDDRAVDIEVCPKCQQLKVVYDCPQESCQKKQSATQLCRACTTCIARCFDCGCCLNNCDYKELSSFELICLDCLRKLRGCQEKEQKMTNFKKTTVVHNGKSYQFFLYGFDA
ncbi:F-box protein SKIP14-like [Lycium barbarum]|uniref:F-box protein SKIP14-like n=1 Tax=Lycium barbarum TaxID=112863 RepID=UPI00293EE603|nr:F-box protein SKIP14-like [Lycium barbarum]